MEAMTVIANKAASRGQLCQHGNSHELIPWEARWSFALQLGGGFDPEGASHPGMACSLNLATRRQVVRQCSSIKVQVKSMEIAAKNRDAPLQTMF
jgi:hypothetical protein